MDVLRILFVDDTFSERSELIKQLEDHGAEVLLVHDDEEAFEIAFAQKLTLIVTKVELPHLDGIELCQKLKESPVTRGIPVVIFSSNGSDADVGRGFQAGAAAYVSKSEVKDLLYDTIENILKKAEFQRERLILVVDDSRTTRKIVKEALSKAGFQVMTAENGKNALELIQNQRPDLILCDINMPVMDGMVFCERVHTKRDLSSIPFVVMSSEDERSVMRRMLQRGANAYLVKPFNLEQLVIIVERLLESHYLFLLKDRERIETERNAMLASITSLVQALEARDTYTRGHSETVASIATGMAQMLELDPGEIEMIKVGARLHDLGKIGVPDWVLQKPGTLSKEEFDIIKRHPVIGSDILMPIPSIAESLPIVLHHHERFDGAGYPYGLKGQQIPLWARITAVADTYDAITSNRSYRWATSQDSALEIIYNMRGTQLCPECVNALMKYMENDKEKGISFFHAD